MNQPQTQLVTRLVLDAIRVRNALLRTPADLWYEMSEEDQSEMVALSISLHVTHPVGVD